MPAPAALPAPEFFPPALLADVLAVSLTAINLLRPLYDASGELIDFAVDYLNPAAQRMTGLAERPGGTMRTRFPDTFANGVFDLYKRVFEPGEAGRHDFYYQADGFDNYFQVAARRSGGLLVVSFTDTADQPRTAAEVALRESQAREQAAYAEVEVQRQRFYDVLMQLPAHVAVHEGPEQVFTLVNPYYRRIANNRDLVGQPIREAWPELVTHGILDLLDQVYHTGEPFVASALPVQADFTRTGQLEQVYYDFFFLALRDIQGQITGVLNFSYDVTAQVLARQAVEEKERQTNDLNEELQATNEEIRANNDELARTQQQLRALNSELEARVQERTQKLTQQSHRLTHLLAEAPAAIATLTGPDLVFELLNEKYQALFPNRPLLGKPVLEALPELVGSGLDAVLRGVYETGITFEGTDVRIDFAHPGDGQPEDRYFNFIYQARYAADGRIDGLVLFGFEVTEQVRMRQQIQAQRFELQTLIEQTPTAICVYEGPQHIIELVNPLMGETMGHAPAQLLGRPLFENLPEVEAQGLGRLLDEVRRTGIPYHTEAYPLQLSWHPPGVTGYFDFIYQPLYRPGRPLAVVCVAAEVSDRVRARQQIQDLNQELAAINEELLATNEELHESNTRLTRTNADLDNFIYTASHDLKAPISNIEGLLLLLEDLLPAELRTDDTLLPVLSRMQDAVERFTRTIGHLTEVSKLQLEFAQSAAPTPLLPVLDDVRQDLGPLLAETGGRLEVDVAECPLLLISEKNLRSLLYNLLSNALKYRHPDRPPVVRLSCRLEDGRRVLRVQDNGLGLSEGQQAKLFQLFGRLHTHVEGTGVGLYMVKKMVENTHGTLTVASREGEGTTFTASFPA